MNMVEDLLLRTHDVILPVISRSHVLFVSARRSRFVCNIRTPTLNFILIPNMRGLNRVKLGGACLLQLDLDFLKN